MIYKTEFRVLIKHCFLTGKDTVQTRIWLEKNYGKSAPSKATICGWFNEFKQRRRDTSDATRSGRPIEASIPENIKKLHRIVLNDRKVKVRELADMLKISAERVHHILHEHLQMKKLCARWVPRLLTIDEKH